MDSIKKPKKYKQTINERRAAEREKTANEGAYAYALTQKGAKRDEIAKALGKTPSAVSALLRRFKHHFPMINEVEQFHQIRDSAYEATEYLVLKAINDKITDGIEDIKLGEMAKALQVVHSADRLNKNLSTANVEVKSQVSFVNLDDVKDD